MALAVEMREPFLCSVIPAASSWTSECYRRVAAVTGQSLLCRKIGPPQIQAQCYAAAAAVNRDAASCKPMLDADKERKKKESALPAIEVGDTDWHVDANYKACVAVAQRNTAGCEAIDPVKDSDARRLCFQELAFANADPSLCARLQTEGTSLFVHDCISEIGMRTARSSICEQIEVPKQGGSMAYRDRRDCLDSVALFSRSGVRCEDRDPLCAGRTAAATRDLTVCRKLRSYTEIDNCLMAYAWKARDSGACAEMQNSARRSICQDVAGGAAPQTPPPIQVATPQPPSPDGRPAARRNAELAEQNRRDAVSYLSRFILEDLQRLDRRSEERMRIDLMKSGVSESSPPVVLIRLRSSEIILKMRWCNEGEVDECVRLGEDLFRNCQFNQAQDIFLRAREHLSNMPPSLDGILFDPGIRQEVAAGVHKSDPSRRSESCATYALRCCGSAEDEEEAPLWERLWTDYRRNANAPFHGLPIENGLERLWLGAVQGVHLRKHYELVRGLEQFDAEAAKPAAEAFLQTAQRSCNAGRSIPCRVLTEAFLFECRFKEAEASYRRMLEAHASEVALLDRINTPGEAAEILRKELKQMPQGLPNPATFSPERRTLCDRLRSRP